METLHLAAKARTTDMDVKDLRNESQVPCVVYGNADHTMFSVQEQEFHRIFAKAGESTVVELDIDGKKLPVLIHMVDLDPVTDRYEHIDFYAVDLKKEVTTNVPIITTGESPAVENNNGVLVHVMNELSVTALPNDLPHDFQVDISSLVEFGDTITLADVTVPGNVTVEHEPDTVLLTVQEPRQEKEPEPTEEAEGEEGAEGEKKEGEESGEEKKEDAEKKEGE